METSSQRIAFVVNKYFPFGGMQRTMLRVATECHRRGYRVEAIAGQWQGPIPEGIDVQVVTLRALTNHGRNSQLEKALNQWRRVREYACVVGFTKMAGLDIYYSGDPCLASRLEETQPRLYKYLSRYRTLLKQEKAVFQRGLKTEILAIAHGQKQEYIRHYQTEENRFHLLPPGINRQRLLANVPTPTERQALRAQYEIGATDTMLLSVGSGFRTKGVDRTIAALAALPDRLKAGCKWVIVGDGDPNSYMRRARKLGVENQVRFVGASEEVAAFYHSADILVHPAITENTGTVLLEAMICGLPVLVTGNCGYAHHIERARAGLVCPLPYSQSRFDRLLQEMVMSASTVSWGDNGKAYASLTDLYSLIDKAADIIIRRVDANQLKN